MSLRFSALALSAALALLPALGHAADYRTEYDKKIKAAQDVGALGNDLAGDRINFYTGATSFNATDVSVPGNDGLSVAVGRSYAVEPNRQRAITGLSGSEVVGVVPRAFGDWDLDIPYLSTTMTQQNGWIVDTTTPSNRCSVIGQAKPGGASGQPNGAPPVDSTLGAGSMGPHKYWHGYSLHLPGGDQTMLLASLPNNERPSTGGPYHWTTNQDWWFSCLSATANNAGGEAFVAMAPDGTKYTFDWLSQRNIDDVVRTVESQGTQIYTYVTYRAEVLMLPTRIEDRFGNWVQYSWSSDAFARLQTITAGPVGSATPDRSVTLSYNAQGFVSTVSDGARTWAYTYTNGSLTQVTLPDGSAWQYSLASLNALDPSPPAECEFDIEQDPWGCFGNPSGVLGTPTAYVVHPSGARVDFTFAAHFQLGGQDGWFYPLGIQQKTVSGPGLTSGTWKYAFSPSVLEAKTACQTTACPGRIATDEVAPDNRVTRRVFGIAAEIDESLLLAQFDGVMTATATSSGGTAAISCTPAYCSHATAISQIDGTTVPVFYREAIHTYVPASPAPAYVVRVGANPLTGPVTQGATYPSERRLPVQTRVSTQQGVAFTHTVHSFNVYAQPTSLTRSSTGSAGGNASRSETMTYAHDTAKWVIGQVASVTDVGTGKVISQTDYDSARLPWKTYAFGVLQQTLTYNANGTLATVTDGRNNVISLSNWFRGIPQRIDYPTGVFETAAVNGLGQITSTTDELGSSTAYGYDAMGRLSSIAYPTGDSTSWNPLSRGFVAVAASEYGIGAGHWKQTVQTGNGQATTYYDAQWRPVLVRTEDTGNAASQSFVVTRYDSAGHPVFQSYPVPSLTTVNDTLTGINTVYDALGRVYQVKQDSELGVLTTTTEYLSGFITRVTNPRGIVSESKYQLFDSPSMDAPVNLVAAKGLSEQQTTVISRDGFGKPTAITRSGSYGGSSVSATRSYVYDANERLCKTVNPESGAALVDYDAAGNLAWSAEGTTLTTLTCNRASVSASAKITRTYDAMNRVTAIATPGGTADVTTTYTADGLVASLTAANPGGNNVTTSYTYNLRRLLTGESSLNGGTLYSLGYGYTGNGHLSTLTYPDVSTVSYSPDALGRATAVTDNGGHTYASAISYFANGAISQFTYGNGITHTLTKNARQLPSRSQDLNGATAILDDTYVFDAHGNVTDITDQAQAGLTTRGMAYDGLDRLTTAVAPSLWGNATYAYDPLDNLRVADVGTRQYRYTYDAAKNRLLNIKTPAGATQFAFTYDARGNTLSKTGSSYAFDAANRMSQVTGQQVYRYDGQGRRVQTTDVADGKQTYWIYSQAGQVLYTSEARRSQNLSYIYLGNTQVATKTVAWGSGATTVRYQHTDSLGSIVAETDANKQVVKRNSYEPYGKAWNSTIDGTGYTGHVMDAATGLTYAQARYYDPSIGRFLSIDPALSEFNLYSYASNSPYGHVDPDGRASESIGADWNSHLCDMGCDSTYIAPMADGGGGGSTKTMSAAELRKMFGKGTQGMGHHWVPFGSTTELDISFEARTVFGQSVSGEKLPDQDHLPGHSKYTDAVRGELQAYAKENKINLSKMTANQARDFVEHIRGSTRPAISNLNGRVIRFTERVRGMAPAAKAIFRTLAAWGVVDYAESNISINSAACRANSTCNAERIE